MKLLRTNNPSKINRFDKSAQVADILGFLPKSEPPPDLGQKLDASSLWCILIELNVLRRGTK